MRDTEILPEAPEKGFVEPLSGAFHASRSIDALYVF